MYVLSAIGVIFYALAIRRVEPNVANLRPFITGIFITAVLLLILDFGMYQLREVKRVQWLAKYLAVGFAVVFMIIASVIAFWLVIYILQDTGLVHTANALPLLPQFALYEIEGEVTNREPEVVTENLVQRINFRPDTRWSTPKGDFHLDIIVKLDRSGKPMFPMLVIDYPGYECEVVKLGEMPSGLGDHKVTHDKTNGKLTIAPFRLRKKEPKEPYDELQQSQTPVD
jgi:hypothetical protein